MTRSAMTDMPTVNAADTGRRRPLQEPASAPASSDPAAQEAADDRAGAVDHALVRSVMIGLMLAMFLSALEQSIVAPALPTIGRSFADIENLPWVVTAYLLSATAVTPLFGKLSDIYGRRVILLIAIGIFIAGSIACALAPTMPALILARGVQGIGGGGIIPLAQTIIADLLSPRERPRYQSYSAITFVSASILGPVVGGFLTDQLHWSLIFWINLPLGAVALLVSDRPLRRLPRHERPHRLDVIGAVLMVGAAVALMLALTWGGTRYAWTSLPILALIAGSAVLWVSFALRLTVAPEPFIPTTMLRDPVVGAIVAAGFFSIGTIVGLSIALPLYFQLVLGLSASASGLALISFMAGSVIGSMIAGRLVAELARYKRVPMIGLAVAIAMLAVFAIRPANLSVGEVAALLVVGGLGLGTMYPITTILIQNTVPLHQVGTATGTLNFFRLLGGAIIVAAFGAIILGAIGAPDAGFTNDTLPATGRLSPVDFSARFRWVFVAAAVFLTAALLAVMRVDERPLRGPR